MASSTVGAGPNSWACQRVSATGQRGVDLAGVAQVQRLVVHRVPGR
ncbi:hypothetical protein [Nonomuraea mangrovi]